MNGESIGGFVSTESSDRTLLVVSSYHRRNTETIAKVISDILGARIVAPENASLDDIQDIDLIGLGSGIYGAKHHDAVLDFTRRLPQVTGKRAFIFSTSAIITKSKVASDHATLRMILASKGYEIAGEFSCRGFNTNSFMKLFGGMNKGRPNSEDLANARSFALNLKQKAVES